MSFFKLSWWGIGVSVKKASIIIVSLIPAIGLFALPVQITVDSIFYISSAKSFFAPDYSELYVWYREPVYPLFLRFIHLFGDSAQYVLLVQSFFIALTFVVLLYIFTRALQQRYIKRWLLLVILLLAINPIFFQYAGSFLQQALFCLYLSLFALMVEWARVRPKKLSLGIYIFLYLSLYVVTILTSIVWLYFGFIPFLFSAYYILKDSRLDLKVIRFTNQIPKTMIFGLLALLIALLTLFTGRGVYALWEGYKAPFAAQVNYRSYVVEPLSSLPPLKDPVYVAERMLALMDIGQISPYESQNDTFLNASLSLGDPKSDYDGAYVNLPFSDYAFGYFTLSNPSIIGHSLLSSFSPISIWIYRGVFVLSGIGLVIFALKRKWALLAFSFLPIGFSFIHAYNGTPVDRYGIPTYPFAVIMLATAIVILFSKPKLLQDFAAK